MVKAIWNNTTIAECDKSEIIEIESNYYFPPKSVNKKYLKESKTHSTCPWKGEANYYDVSIDNKTNKDAAWYYPDPKPEAKKIKNYIAFWKGIEISEN